jgi:hypothetical protein
MEIQHFLHSEGQMKTFSQAESKYCLDLPSNQWARRRPSGGFLDTSSQAGRFEVERKRTERVSRH